MIHIYLENYIANVYDVTVGYPSRIVCSELELLRDGRFPSDVHFDVKRYAESELPEVEDDIAMWLKNLWEEKEARLQKFYTANSKDRAFDPSGEKHIWPVGF